MFNAENLKQTDPLVLEIINRELLRQNEELELIFRFGVGSHGFGLGQ